MNKDKIFLNNCIWFYWEYSFCSLNIQKTRGTFKFFNSMEIFSLNSKYKTNKELSE